MSVGKPFHLLNSASFVLLVNKEVITYILHGRSKAKSIYFLYSNSPIRLYAFNVYNKTFICEIINKKYAMNVKNIYIFIFSNGKSGVMCVKLWG